MATIRTVVVLPERQNTFFNRMAALLPIEVYNTGPDHMIPRLDLVEIRGTVPALATVKVFINGVDQSPVPDIVADAEGNWSHLIRLNPGSNTIQVQYFPPEIAQDLDNNYQPTLLVDNVLIHPTLFSPFPMQNVLQMLLLDGNFLFLGNYIPPPVNGKTIARYDLTTGASIILDLSATTPTSGRVFFMALDSNWFYSAQTMGDASIRLSRYAKDLSARTDILTYATVPNALYADGTHLYAVRNSGVDTFLTKIDPATFMIIGAEINIKNGTPSESVIAHSVPGDDGTNLMIPTSRLIAGDSPTNDYLPGNPDLPSGTNLIFEENFFHRKIRKSDMFDLGNFTLIGNTHFPVDSFEGKNSMVRFSGFYYAMVRSDLGKVIKLQETAQYGLPALVPVEVTPLPFSTVGSADSLPPQMRLGPDNRLYVVGNDHLARFTPGATSIDHIPRGVRSIDADADRVAVIDDVTPERAIAASLDIFADRAQTFTIMTPSAPPSNLRVHFNSTHTRIGLGWDPVGDGSAFIIEQALNEGAFSEIGREYFGNGFSARSTLLPVGWHSGDSLKYRVRSFNLIGSSAPSATAQFDVPFLTPFLGDCDNLVTISVIGNSVTLEFEDNEIALGQPIDNMTNRPHVLFLYRSPNGIDNWTQVAARSMIPDNVQPDGTPVGGAFTYNPSTRANTLVQMSDTNAGAYPYFYRVRAEQNDGPSLSFPAFRYGPGGYSNVLEVNAPPAAPSNLLLTNVFEGTLSSWTSNSGGTEDGFEIWRSTHPDSSGTATMVGSVGTGVTEFVDTSVAYGIRYYYKVRAFNASGDSAFTALGESNLPASNGLSAIFFFPEIRVESTTGLRHVRADGSYYYAAAQALGMSLVVRVLRVDKTDSRIVTSHDVFTAPSGSVEAIGSWMFGGFLYVVTNGAGENARLLKINTTTMMLDSSVLLSNTGARATISDDGAFLYVTVSGSSTMIYKIDPSDLSVDGSNTLSGIFSGSLSSSIYMGASIYAVYAETASTIRVSEISPSTLAIVNSSSSLTGSIAGTAFAAGLVGDGTHIYALYFESGLTVKVRKFSVGPITDVGDVTVTGASSTGEGEGLVLIGGALYATVRGSTSARIRKITTALALGTEHLQLDLDSTWLTIADGIHIVFSAQEGNSPPVGGKFIGREDSTLF